MGAVLLRLDRCLNCGGPMSGGGRIDRRYCKPSCRTLAYRIRKRSGTPARRRVSVPQWAEGQPPVIGSALVALAELQARVLHLAHHLEQDDIAFRHPVSVDPPSVNTINPELMQQLEALETELRQAQADKTAAEQHAQAMSQELAQVQQKATQVQTRIISLSDQLEQAEKQQSQWQGQTEALRDALSDVTRRADDDRAKLEKTEQALAKKSADYRSLWGQLSDASQAAERMRKELERTTPQLELATKKIKDLEAKTAEHRPLTEELSKAQRANQILQAELERLRPPGAESDPLIPLMKDKVVAWHLLAQCEAKHRRAGKGPLFPNYPELTNRPLSRDDAPTILAAAIQAAVEARRGYYYRSRLSWNHQPKWIHDGRLLDATSEKELHEEEENVVASLKSDVTKAKRWTGG